MSLMIYSLAYKDLNLLGQNRDFHKLTHPFNFRKRLQS